MIKKYLRWLIVGLTLFFVVNNLKNNWQSITSIRIEPRGWVWLFCGLSITLIAHIWSAWVWTWILKSFRQPIGTFKALGIYLVTNLGKYFPGNVGHFYARIVAINKAGLDRGNASLSVLLEPLLMATAALFIAVTAGSFGLIKESKALWIQILTLVIILIGIHPRILNLPIKLLGKIKKNKGDTIVYLTTYPLIPLLGEIGFVLFRGSGFLLTWMVLSSIDPRQIPSLLGSFSFAWLLGLIVPGAPGGLGVFEATTIALLDRQSFPPATVLVTVALYRFISIIAEIIGAGIGTLIVREPIRDR